VILMWSNDTSFLTLASLGIALGALLIIDRNARSFLKPLIGVAICILLLWLPYLPKLIQQTDGVISDFWIPPPTAWYIKDTLRSLISLSSMDALWWAVAALCGGLYLMKRSGLWREALMLGSLIALPLILNYVMSITLKPIFLSRTLIGVTPAVVVLMSSSAVLLRSIAMRPIAITALIAAHIFAVTTWDENDPGNEPWDRIAKEIVSANVSSDPQNKAIVLLTANQLALPLSHALEEIKSSLPLQGAPVNFPAPGLNARYPSGKCAPSVAGQDLSLVANRVLPYAVVYFVTRTNNVYDPGNGVAKFLVKLGFKQSFVETFAPGSIELHKFAREDKHQHFRFFHPHFKERHPQDAALPSHKA
jgi:hypothetical protein